MSTTTARPSPAKKRLLDAATDLFYGEGIHVVGVDRIIEAAGVTRATMYKQFDGKEGLVLAYLQGEDERLRALFAEAGERVGRSRRPARPRDRAASRPTSAIGTPAGAPSSTPPPSIPTTDRCANSSPITASGSAATLEQLASAAGLAEPAEVAASLVLLRDAALVGGYLDGQDRVAPAFARTARGVIAAHRR